MKIPKIIKRLSIFDIGLVVIIAVLGISFFLFFYRKAEYVSIRVKVTDQDVLYARTLPATWYANQFHIGDIEKDALGRPITEITGIESFNMESNKKAVYLDLRVRAVYDTRTKRYSARGRNLMFGTPLRMNLSQVTFDGFITEFPGSGYQKDLTITTSTVLVLGRKVEPSLTDSVKIGDKVYDSNGVLLAEIKNIVVRQAEEVTQTDNGDLLLRSNPLYKDILLTVSLRTKTIHNETFAFDNVPVKVGEFLPLNFHNVSLFPIIVNFTNVQ